MTNKLKLEETQIHSSLQTKRKKVENLKSLITKAKAEREAESKKDVIKI